MISAFGLTDVGRKRRHNEDAYLLDVERGLFVVADGMGGHAAGEVASRITVESIQEFIAGTEEEHENTWPFGFNNRYSLEGNRLTTAVEKANEKVMRAVQNRPELKGMGTTVVAALFDDSNATLVHVGDSRAYLFRDGELRRLTDDHSWVQEQVNAGILSEDEAKSHPLKNVVTRALGGAAHVAVDLIEVPTTTGDRFLLCSDGLTGMMSDEEIMERLRAGEPLDKTVRMLVDMANERGGIDNITAIVVEVDLKGHEHLLEDLTPTLPVEVSDRTASTVRTRPPLSGPLKTSDKTTGDKTTGDKTTGDKTPGDKTPGDKTPGDKTPGDKPSPDKPPGETAPQKASDKAPEEKASGAGAGAPAVPPSGNSTKEGKG